jgi:hypothetical protein
VLADEEFTWPDGTTEHAVDFEIANIREKNGYGPLKAKLYSGEYPIAVYEFAIVQSQ